MGGSSLSARGGTYRGYAPRPRRWWHKEPVVTSPARATDSEGVGDQSRRHARPESSRPCSLLLAARRPAHGLEAWAEVQRRGYEGLVAKDEASAYLGGRTRAWLKVKRRNGDGARSANGAACDSVQFSVEPRHCMLLGEKSEFLHSVAAFPPRGAYGPQGSTCPRSESGGVRALRVTASLASPAI